MQAVAKARARRERLLGLVGIGLLAALWGLFLAPGHTLVPPLMGVLRELLALAREGPLLRDAFTSLARVVPGTGLAFLLASSLAGVTVLSRQVGHVVGGALELLRPVPPIAWIPVAILLFGIGSAPAIAIVTVGAFFPIWLGAQQGLEQVRSQDLLAARSFGASRWVLFWDVVLPSALPALLHGLRLGLGLGWFCVVAAEMMGAQSGLGYGVQAYSLNLELERTYGYILLIGGLGAVMNFTMRWIEAKATRWQEKSMMDHG